MLHITRLWVLSGLCRVESVPEGHAPSIRRKGAILVVLIVMWELHPLRCQALLHSYVCARMHLLVVQNNITAPRKSCRNRHIGLEGRDSNQPGLSAA